MAMKCARCAELDEQIEWYRTELGLVDEATKIAQTAHKLSLQPSEAYMALMLYNAKGRVLTTEFIEAALPSVQGKAGERGFAIVRVYALAIRRSLGKDALHTARSFGYQMTPKGMARMRRLLGEEALAA